MLHDTGHPRCAISVATVQAYRVVHEPDERGGNEHSRHEAHLVPSRGHGFGYWVTSHEGRPCRFLHLPHPSWRASTTGAPPPRSSFFTMAMKAPVSTRLSARDSAATTIIGPEMP